MRIKVDDTCDGRYMWTDDTCGNSSHSADRMAALTVGFFPFLYAEIAEIGHNKQSNKNNPVMGWEKEQGVNGRYL